MRTRGNIKRQKICSDELQDAISIIKEKLSTSELQLSALLQQLNIPEVIHNQIDGTKKILKTERLESQDEWKKRCEVQKRKGSKLDDIDIEIDGIWAADDGEVESMERKINAYCRRTQDQKDDKDN